MSVLKGTHIGFSYGSPGNLVHSSTLGIVHVSEGNRYTDNLLPTAQEKTAQVPGNDGTYYFGTYYTQKSFSLSIAFDEVDDTKLRQMRQLFGEKGLHQLIFDEFPYKVYNVRVSGTPSFKYVAFDNPNSDTSTTYSADLYYRTGGDYRGEASYTSAGRVYKGEGSINFIAYTPFAQSRYKYINQYHSSNIPEWTPDVYNNLTEWQSSVALVRNDYYVTVGGVNYTIDTPTNTTTLIYNPGDYPTDFMLTVQNSESIPELTVKLQDNELHDTGKIITIGTVTLATGEVGYRINTKLHLIEGILTNGQISGNIYNREIKNGDFFQFPQMTPNEPMFLKHQGSGLISTNFFLDYKYLFY